ncbi:MAG: Nif3-like dinuclear metal center hexameric protein, partial [Planctomycetes bacterium]|nr:Nif3-like dinuclear metal center hexameric protein [Planctomycetota bacterium]
MPVKLDRLLCVLQELAPLELAEEWDNAGLLLCPSRKKFCRKILLTIDLVESVLDEALRAGADTIVALATPAGESAIGVVRLSGDVCEFLPEAIFKLPSPTPRTAH